jgi:hypothetical protein
MYGHLVASTYVVLAISPNVAHAHVAFFSVGFLRQSILSSLDLGCLIEGIFFEEGGWLVAEITLLALFVKVKAGFHYAVLARL